VPLEQPIHILKETILEISEEIGNEISILTIDKEFVIFITII